MILDFGDGFFLRHAASADHAALCMICLRTGDAGQDATAREDDPDLMGQIYAVPYQVFEPDFAFVVDHPHGIAGYLFGAPDTTRLYARLAAEWYPALRARVADPGLDPSRWRGSDWARAAIHRPAPTIPETLQAYPSHGHIDLLPPARGKGIGRRCITFLEKRLRDAGSTGLWLDVHPRNLSARAFYRKLGFQVVGEAPPSSIFMAKALAAAL